MTRPEKTPLELGFSMPPEWAPHAATWLAWPHNTEDWPGKFEPVPGVFVEIARHLSRGRTRAHHRERRGDRRREVRRLC